MPPQRSATRRRIREETLTAMIGGEFVDGVWVMRIPGNFIPEELDFEVGYLSGNPNEAWGEDGVSDSDSNTNEDDLSSLPELEEFNPIEEGVNPNEGSDGGLGLENSMNYDDFISVTGDGMTQRGLVVQGGSGLLDNGEIGIDVASSGVRVATFDPELIETAKYTQHIDTSGLLWWVIQNVGRNTSPPAMGRSNKDNDGATGQASGEGNGA